MAKKNENPKGLLREFYLKGMNPSKMDEKALQKNSTLSNEKT